MRSSWRLAALVALVLAAACDEKDSDFFTTVVGEGDGTLGLAVNGAPLGATVTVTRNGSSVFSGVVGATPHVVEGLVFGTYQVTITPPAGYDCGTGSVSVIVNAITPDPDVVFTCAAPVGSFALSLSGLGSGLSLDMALDGPVNRVGTLGSAGLSFVELPFGTYTWTYPQLSGYGCDPTEGEFTLNTAGQQATAQVSCVATEGSLQVSVAGATASVSYSGPESGGGAVGATPVVFPGLMPGNYTVSVSDPIGFSCTPLSQPAAITAGATTSVQVTCTALPGAVTATVSGTTAQVNHTGTASGGGAVGGTPVVFGDLPAGNYTFAIVQPAGFDCTPATIPVVLAAGGAETVEFTCEPEEPEELVEYSIDLAGFLGAPGAVAPGAYQRAVRDALLVAVATMTINTIGAQTFFGTSPDRLGFNGTSGYELDVLFPVAALFFRIRALQVCTINAALSGSNFLAVSYYTAALVLLSTASITSAPGCFWLDVPLGTRFVRMLGPAVGFVDIHNLLMRGVLEP